MASLSGPRLFDSPAAGAPPWIGRLIDYETSFLAARNPDLKRIGVSQNQLTDHVLVLDGIRSPRRPPPSKSKEVSWLLFGHHNAFAHTSCSQYRGAPVPTLIQHSPSGRPVLTHRWSLLVHRGDTSNSYITLNKHVMKISHG